MIEDTLPEKQARGRLHTTWLGNVITWMGLSLEELRSTYINRSQKGLVEGKTLGGRSFMMQPMLELPRKVERQDITSVTLLLVVNLL